MNLKLRTFFVEDNATIRENLIGTLEELSSVHAIGFAESETNGREWLVDNATVWDLAIVDLFLRPGSGLGVLQACQSRQSTQKVVVLSNFATSDMRQKCLALGADAVFDKSNEIEALVDFCNDQPLNRSACS